MYRTISVLIIVALSWGCTQTSKKEQTMDSKTEIQKRVEEFASFRLSTDLSVLTQKERQMLPLLLKAADIMDEIFWIEAYGDTADLFSEDMDDFTRRYVKINYGPWERLNNNEPFMKGVGKKPDGANFYPADVTRQEFETWEDINKTSLYTLIRRNEEGNLISVPYHIAFREKIERASGLIMEASGLAEDPGLKNYLEKRSQALLTDDYFESDIAWMEMKNNTIEFIIGPIENYEDQLFGYKTAHESFILIKDKEWSGKLEKYTALLPGLQEELPCLPQYKSETPGVDSDINVYDAIYYAGDCNAGSKTIAINLPNDEKVREVKGSRKLQLKNSMQAKFEKILIPIADLVIDPGQRKHVKFDAFFENTMFHEVSHGLGLSNTIGGKGTVREALKDSYTSIEESKADILGLWCVYQLNELGEMGEKDLMDNFVTFMAGIFRSVRFGAASAHGKANMIRFYYFQEAGAFKRNPSTGTYLVDFEKMKEAMLNLSETVLEIQGDGDYDAAKKLIEDKGYIRDELQQDLDRIAGAGIPRDIIFEQGAEVLGL
ncbi:MAG: Zn-dependent hydrolase [Prolixibacteraceae bacterium]|nr:Zn-dependent hydrolase [Prolixibacteraceae bacterium]